MNRHGCQHLDDLMKLEIEEIKKHVDVPETHPDYNHQVVSAINQYGKSVRDMYCQQMCSDYQNCIYKIIKEQDENA